MTISHCVYLWTCAQAVPPKPTGMIAAFGTWRSLVSALVWGTRGRRFKSGRPDSEARDRHQDRHRTSIDGAEGPW